MIFKGRALLAVAIAGIAIGTTACSSTRPQADALAPRPVVAPSQPAPTASPTPSKAALLPAAAPGPYRYVFPVGGNVSYAHTHHDYPATDIMSPCGTPIHSAVDGVVLEVNRVDRWDPKTDLGAWRGGKFLSILGDDGVRYYNAHMSAIVASIAPGVRVAAGETIGNVGETGRASACHLHFAISPPCKRVGDWSIRRGVVWPWSFLDSWRTSKPKSPVATVAAWLKAHGC
jgi:peptidoglycan LD-endopeptidase LytH